MASPYEQDLARLRGALHLGMRAQSNYEILRQHRPLVDAIRYALGLLDRMRPGDETLKNTALMFRLAHRRVTLGEGRTEYLVIDKTMRDAALARIDQLMGPFDEAG